MGRTAYTPNTRRLENIVGDLLADADAESKKWKKRHLQKGLTIHIKRDGNAYALAISRTETYPSYAEWKAVLRAFPWEAEASAEPLDDHDGPTKRYFLRGRVAWQPKLL